MKLKFASLTLAAAVLSVSTAQAVININVSGGVGTPLTIEITGGDTFTATGSSTGFIYVIFENFWDNTTVSTAGNATMASNTISLYDSNVSGVTGAVDGTVAGATLADLIVGFQDVGAFSATDSVVLSTGTRVSSNNLNLNYTTDGPVVGNVYLARFNGTVISDTLTYTGTVPEPSAYAALAGLAALGVVACRRRRANA